MSSLQWCTVLIIGVLIVACLMVNWNRKKNDESIIELSGDVQARNSRWNERVVVQSCLQNDKNCNVYACKNYGSRCDESKLSYPNESPGTESIKVNDVDTTFYTPTYVGTNFDVCRPTSAGGPNGGKCKTYSCKKGEACVDNGKNFVGLISADYGGDKEEIRVNEISISL
jgi:hypothetical protein